MKFAYAYPSAPVKVFDRSLTTLQIQTNTEGPAPARLSLLGYFTFRCEIIVKGFIRRSARRDFRNPLHWLSYKRIDTGDLFRRCTRDFWPTNGTNCSCWPLRHTKRYTGLRRFGTRPTSTATGTTIPNSLRRWAFLKITTRTYGFLIFWCRIKCRIFCFANKILTAIKNYKIGNVWFEGISFDRF